MMFYGGKAFHTWALSALPICPYAEGIVDSTENDP